MDAVEFLEKRNRMCGALGDECTDKDGTLCPLLVAARKVGKGYYGYTKSHPAEAVEIRRAKSMTEKELTAMKAVLHLAMNNPRLRAGGVWVEDVNHYETCSKIKFTEAIGIVGELLYGSNIDEEDDDAD